MAPHAVLRGSNRLAVNLVGKKGFVGLGSLESAVCESYFRLERIEGFYRLSFCLGKECGTIAETGARPVPAMFELGQDKSSPIV